MNVTRHRLAALATTVGALAIAVPAGGASAAIRTLPTRLPSLHVPSFPGFPLPPPGQTFTFSGSGLTIATAVGPAIIGKVVSNGPLGNEQLAVAPGVPVALALMTNTPGSTIAIGPG
jgi:hypothetical protein